MSLLSQRSPLARPEAQRARLNEGSERLRRVARFREKLHEAGLYPLVPTAIDIFQLNVGKMCNQTCKHCHVDAGPDRREIMTRDTMTECLAAIETSGAGTVDITGGAPEMNPEFRWLVGRVRALGREVIVRCNLTILLANRSYHDLPEFFATQQVHVVSSLPAFDHRTDRQRGDGVFEKSVTALRRLNAVGYGREGTGLELDLVYNPVGAFLPGNQAELETQFKEELARHHGIVFNRLFAITNMPISRYLDYLAESGNLDDYMEKLVGAFNPRAAAGVMCRNTVSVGWDGYLYACDFNQMLGMNVLDGNGRPRHVRDAPWAALAAREIEVDQHCFGCTAAGGSSCSGSVTAR